MIVHQKLNFLHLHYNPQKDEDIKLRKVRIVLAVFWTVVVIVLLSYPSNSIPDFDIKIKGLDKLIHFILFFIAGLVWANAINNNYNDTKIFLYIFALGLVLSVMTELVQSLQIIGRTFELLDIIANLLGISFGVKIFSIASRK